MKLELWPRRPSIKQCLLQCACLQLPLTRSLTSIYSGANCQLSSGSEDKNARCRNKRASLTSAPTFSVVIYALSPDNDANGHIQSVSLTENLLPAFPPTSAQPTDIRRGGHLPSVVSLICVWSVQALLQRCASSVGCSISLVTCRWRCCESINISLKAVCKCESM